VNARNRSSFLGVSNLTLQRSGRIMQSRFALVLMSVAGAGLLFCVGLLFGLGVMTPSKGGQHKEIAVTNEPVKVARQATTGTANPNHDLTPLTPVHPGSSAPEQTAKAAEPSPPAPTQPAPAPVAKAPAQPSPAPVAQASAQPAPSAPAQTAAAEPQKPAEPAAKEAKVTPSVAPAPQPSKPAVAEKAAAAPANATPVSLHTKNSCDVQACSRAYKSFRQSDCTYQPYSGPRQLCVSPPTAGQEAARSDDKSADDRSASVRVRRGNHDVEVQNVPREGARGTNGASPRDEDGPVLRRQIRRDVTADGEDDGIDDSRVIVRRSDDDHDRYDDGGWHRGLFAPVEDDDDDQ
jgi:hypothetical protein